MIRSWKRIFAAALLLIAGVLYGSTEPFSDGIKELYSGKSGATAAASAIFARHASGDLNCHAFDLLLKRRNVSADKAGELDQALQKVIAALIAQITTQADARNTFVLSELLADANTPCRDRELAFWLLKYSAEQNYPPAELQLGSYLIKNYSRAGDLEIAERLLQKAAGTFPGTANWQLYKLCTLRQQPDRAAAHLQRAVQHSCAEAAAESAHKEKKLTAGIANLSGHGRFLYTVNSYMAHTRKISELFIAAADNCPDAALPIAVMYNDLVYKDHVMACSTACLAVILQPANIRAQRLLIELDNSGRMAMAMLVMWQNQLKNIHDLRRAVLKDSDLLYDLYLKPEAPGNRQRLTAALQHDTTAFYLSGLVFRLKSCKLTYPEIKKLLQSTPPGQDMLPVITAQLLIAAENKDAAWQLELSAELLRLLAQKWQHFQLPAHRLQLAAVIPGAAKKQRGQSLDMPETIFVLSWNLAVDLRVNALLAAGKQQEAEKFLQKYQRFQLPGTLKNMERNLVRKFAPELTAKPTPAAR